jgi:hypothetical protein
VFLRKSVQAIETMIFRAELILRRVRNVLILKNGDFDTQQRARKVLTTGELMAICEFMNSTSGRQLRRIEAC